MNISEDALMSAYRAIEEPCAEDAGLMVIARAAVEAAAEHIAAQAVRDAALKINTFQFGPEAAPYLSAIKAQVEADADDLDPL